MNITLALTFINNNRIFITLQINMNSEFKVSFSTRVLILDNHTGDVLLDKSNAIHTQNMARIIARGLANEENSTIYRIAFGNGGSFVDAGGNIILNTPNDGTNGEGVDSRLYNETYSEILYGLDNGRDPGSFGPAGIRPGGGENYDPSLLNNIYSEEVGRRSNVIVDAVLSVDEPNTQLLAPTNFVSEEEAFNFDEIGFYSPGGPATNTPGFQRIDVGDKNSDDILPILTDLSTVNGKTFNINIAIDGSSISETITFPLFGSGPSNEITYGDLCKGINEGTWLGGGVNSSLAQQIEVSITDRSEQDYGIISGSNTFGYLTFTSKTVGDASSVSISCADNPTDFFNIWGCESVDTTVLGQTQAGIDERERLLTHLTFPPILKKSNRQLRIIYTLTVSVSQVEGTIVESQVIT
jgi:hypothetical protein